MSKGSILSELQERLQQEKQEFIDENLDDPGSMGGFSNMARLSAAIELLEAYEWDEDVVDGDDPEYDE